MHRTTRVASLVLFGLLAGSSTFALASSGGSPAGSGTVPVTSTATSDGITGTDPEPISPTVVTIILTILNLG